MRRKKNHRLNYGTSIYADESNRLRFLLLQSDSCIFFFLTSSVFEFYRNATKERMNQQQLRWIHSVSTASTRNYIRNIPFDLRWREIEWSSIMLSSLQVIYFTFVLWFLEMKLDMYLSSFIILLTRFKGYVIIWIYKVGIIARVTFTYTLQYRK